ncbi:SGNH/GDSL hydrolase family protein [Actinophytocola algeriensis]|uniref:Lysophospholipase L1-like esterase n=1 Tax=Actinophytocola algeriensis TaxID=1768010 RepID=A0A7W7Q046_9PSEU|nr:SGNH/GDSL hydrolase family protein [Actinophytocola algeriensis]MBB4904524.1 lysophospholipase L1-like esterase [Actinophytocola algeriensis]MBE1476617.1 lysophospholipase L1-like esterase [Actinophytocola algeriensis]
MHYRRYVAIGDSCAEGLDDPYPDGSGYRGWADLVAGELARVSPSLEYANLAVRGRRLDQILTEQVPNAVAHRPDLVTLFGGGNDVLQGRWRTTAESLDEIVTTMAGVAETVVLFTLPDIARLPGLGRLRPRVRRLNDLITETATKHGTLLIDVRDDEYCDDERLYGGDRLHLGPRGHHRVAAHVLTSLALTPDPAWLAPLPPAVREPVWRSAAQHWSWLRHHVYPAVHDTVRNKLIGRQPGDGLVAKRPDPAPVTPML